MGLVKENDLRKVKQSVDWRARSSRAYRHLLHDSVLFFFLPLLIRRGLVLASLRVPRSCRRYLRAFPLSPTLETPSRFARGILADMLHVCAARALCVSGSFTPRALAIFAVRITSGIRQCGVEFPVLQKGALSHAVELSAVINKRLGVLGRVP